MPAKGSTKLTAQKFNTIKAQTRGGGTAELIAAANGVKPSTVRNIDRYTSLAAMRAAQATAAEKRAKKEANKSLEDYEKQLDAVVSKPENQIPARRSQDATQPVPKYITAQELDVVAEDIMKHMSARINTLSKKVEDLQAFRDNIKATWIGRLIAKRGSKG